MSRRSRTRRQMRISIWDRTAPLPMACWLGRCVAAIEIDRDGPAAAGDGIGAVVGFFGHFGVFVHDDDQGRLIGCGFPDALAFAGHLLGPLVQPANGIAEQFAGLVRGRGQPGKAGRPGSEFHAAFEVYSPDFDVAAGG